MLQIAGGIILAVLFFIFLPVILAFGFALVVIAMIASVEGVVFWQIYKYVSPYSEPLAVILCIIFGVVSLGYLAVWMDKRNERKNKIGESP